MANRYGQERKISAQLIVIAPYNGLPQRDFGVFPNSEGFGFEREDIKYGEYPVATGIASREDATLKRLYGDASPEQEAWLEANSQSPCLVIRSYKGDDDLAIGVPRTYTGVVKGVKPPDGDETGSGRTMLEVTCILDVPAS